MQIKLSITIPSQATLEHLTQIYALVQGFD